MGYNLTIGEAQLEWDVDCVRITADTVRLEDAPAFGEPTDHTNERWPSYTSWSKFSHELDIVDVMFCSRNGGAGEFRWNGEWRPPLLESHPGVSPVTKEHLEATEAKLAIYRKQNPDHFAQYPPPKPGAKPLAGTFYRSEDLVDDPRYDGNLCRAEWLVFWLRWAVENCERPVFVNG